MSSSLSTSNENAVDSMPRGGNVYYSSQQQQQQYHYHMNQPLNYNNSINGNNTSIHNQSYNLNAANYLPNNNHYNNHSINNYQHQQLLNNNSHHQAHHNSINTTSQNSSSHQHYQHPSIATVFPSIYADSLMSNNQEASMIAGAGASNSSLISGTGSVSGASNSIQGGASLMGNSYSSVQKQIQQDWSNREYIEVIISNIKKLTDFLNSFELSCKSKLAMLDEKLTKLERQIDFVEAKVTKGETLN